MVCAQLEVGRFQMASGLIAIVDFIHVNDCIDMLFSSLDMAYLVINKIK